MAESSSVDLHGTRLAYDLASSGRPVLFVHGYPLSRALWRPQICDLADTALVLAPDLRGHGDSMPPTGPYQMEALADDLHHLLLKQEIAQPDEAEVMHASITISRLKLLPDVGHLLNLERPQSFNTTLREFLNAC
jgi:pimeloyl-ACP methyl ester carboxylesterase